MEYVSKIDFRFPDFVQVEISSDDDIINCYHIDKKEIFDIDLHLDRTPSIKAEITWWDKKHETPEWMYFKDKKDAILAFTEFGKVISKRNGEDK